MKRFVYGIVVEVEDDVDLFEFKKYVASGVRFVQDEHRHIDNGISFEVCEELAREVDDDYVLI